MTIERPYQRALSTGEALAESVPVAEASSFPPW